MVKFIIKRCLAMIPVLLGVTLLVFVVMSLAPGNPAKIILGVDATPEAVEALTEELGLNDPVLLRYVRYIADFCRGDLGTSYVSQRPVADEVFARFPYTLKLALVAAVMELVISIPVSYTHLGAGPRSRPAGRPAAGSAV